MYLIHQHALLNQRAETSFRIDFLITIKSCNFYLTFSYKKIFILYLVYFYWIIPYLTIAKESKNSLKSNKKKDHTISILGSKFILFFVDNAQTLRLRSRRKIKASYFSESLFYSFFYLVFNTIFFVPTFILSANKE